MKRLGIRSKISWLGCPESNTDGITKALYQFFFDSMTISYFPFFNRDIVLIMTYEQETIC